MRSVSLLPFKLLIKSFSRFRKRQKEESFHCDWREATAYNLTAIILTRKFSFRVLRILKNSLYLSCNENERFKASPYLAFGTSQWLLFLITPYRMETSIRRALSAVSTMSQILANSCPSFTVTHIRRPLEYHLTLMQPWEASLRGWCDIGLSCKRWHTLKILPRVVRWPLIQ